MKKEEKGNGGAFGYEPSEQRHHFLQFQEIEKGTLSLVKKNQERLAGAQKPQTDNEGIPEFFAEKKTVKGKQEEGEIVQFSFLHSSI